MADNFILTWLFIFVLIMNAKINKITRIKQIFKVFICEAVPTIGSDGRFY
jgi:hypothetical protein